MIHDSYGSIDIKVGNWLYIGSFCHGKSCNLYTSRKKLSDDEKFMYDTYAIDFEMNDASKADCEKNLLEKFMYVQMKANGEAGERVDKLIELTRDEINKQFERKNHIENRSGFIFALWGVLLGIALDQNYISSINSLWESGCQLGALILGIFAVGVLITIVLSLVNLAMVIRSDKLSRFRVDDVQENYITAVKDGELMRTVMLEYYTLIWSDNEKIINEKGEKQNKALRTIMICIALMIVSKIVFG